MILNSLVYKEKIRKKKELDDDSLLGANDITRWILKQLSVQNLHLCHKT